MKTRTWKTCAGVLPVAMLLLWFGWHPDAWARKVTGASGSEKSSLALPASSPNGGIPGRSAPATQQQPAIQSGNDESARFAAASVCARYERLSRFLEDASRDPVSVINDARTSSETTETQRRALEANRVFVEKHRQACSSAEMQAQLAGTGMYDLAEREGRAGNLQAAACFVLAQWPLAGLDERATHVFAEKSRSTAKELFLKGIRAGDWKMVNAAVSVSRSQHRIPISLVLTVEERYYLYRLSWLGTYQSSWKNEMAREAKTLSASLSAASLARADDRAASDFVRYFLRQPMHEDDQMSCDI